MLPAQAAALEVRKRLLNPQAAMNVQCPVPDIVPPPTEVEALTRRIEVLEKLLGMRRDVGIARRVQEAVALHYGIAVEELLSSGRAPHIVVPRWVAMFLVSKITRESFSRVASRFGGFDHSTILKAIRSIERRRAKDAKLDEELKTFLAAFRGRS